MAVGGRERGDGGRMRVRVDVTRGEAEAAEMRCGFAGGRVEGGQRG